MLPQPYLFDGLAAHPGQAVLQAHPASGYVYDWIKNPIKPGGGVPQGKTWTYRGQGPPPLGSDFLPAPKIEILTPQASGGVGTGSGGGGAGGLGGGSPGGGGHMLK
jgi:hypothetical protein